MDIFGQGRAARNDWPAPRAHRSAQRPSGPATSCKRIARVRRRPYVPAGAGSTPTRKCGPTRSRSLGPKKNPWARQSTSRPSWLGSLWSCFADRKTNSRLALVDLALSMRLRRPCPNGGKLTHSDVDMNFSTTMKQARRVTRALRRPSNGLLSVSYNGVWIAKANLESVRAPSSPPGYRQRLRSRGLGPQVPTAFVSNRGAHVTNLQ